MLPDLPKIKAHLHEIMMRYVRIRTHRQLGVFNEVPKHIIHEGNALRVARATGDTEESELMESSIEKAIPKEQIPHLSFDDRIKILDELADGLARDMAKKLYDALGESLDRAGQSHDNRGKPLDAESILAIFGKMEFEFDINGKPSMPTISVAPESVEALRQAFQQLETHPELAARFEELMAQKRVNWRDREASRKLVG